MLLMCSTWVSPASWSESVNVSCSSASVAFLAFLGTLLSVVRTFPKSATAVSGFSVSASEASGVNWTVVLRSFLHPWYWARLWSESKWGEYVGTGASLGVGSSTTSWGMVSMLSVPKGTLGFSPPSSSWLKLNIERFQLTCRKALILHKHKYRPRSFQIVWSWCKSKKNKICRFYFEHGFCFTVTMHSSNAPCCGVAGGLRATTGVVEAAAFFSRILADLYCQTITSLKNRRWTWWQRENVFPNWVVDITFKYLQ